MDDEVLVMTQTGVSMDLCGVRACVSGSLCGMLRVYHKHPLYHSLLYYFYIDLRTGVWFEFVSKCLISLIQCSRTWSFCV